MRQATMWIAAGAFGLFVSAGRIDASQLITNGGFESNGGAGTSIFTGWTETNQAGGNGSIFVQTGTSSPLESFTVPAPPQGSFAAMSDQGGPGSHVLIQDFVVPVGVTAATFSFQEFIQNQAGVFFSPNSLDYTVTPNQQARVDIITTTSNPFSVASGDVLQNLFQTNPGDPLHSGYNLITVDLTALLAANGGNTLALRFAEADNQSFINFGFDAVSINATAGAIPAVPEPSTILSAGVAGLVGLVMARRRRAA